MWVASHSLWPLDFFLDNQNLAQMRGILHEIGKKPYLGYKILLISIDIVKSGETQMISLDIYPCLD